MLPTSPWKEAKWLMAGWLCRSLSFRFYSHAAVRTSVQAGRLVYLVPGSQAVARLCLRIRYYPGSRYNAHTFLRAHSSPFQNYSSSALLRTMHDFLLTPHYLLGRWRDLCVQCLFHFLHHHWRQKKEKTLVITHFVCPAFIVLYNAACNINLRLRPWHCLFLFFLVLSIG